MGWVLSTLTAIASTGCMVVFPVPATGKGCAGEAAGYYPASQVVRLRAADELDCAPEALHIVAQSDTTFHVSGCGQSDTFMCEADAVSGCSLEDAAERESCRAASDSE